MEDLQYEEEPVRRFAGLMLRDPLPDDSTIQHFRHLLEEHQMGRGLFAEVSDYLESRGLWVQGER